MAARVSSHVRYGPRWRALRKAVFAAKGRRCWWCGNPATTVDHVVARVLGGEHSIENLVPSCARCNYSRGASLGNRLRAPLPLSGRQRQAIALRAARSSRDW